MSYPDHKNKEHREAIRRNLSNCGSGVIEDACDMIDSLERQLAAANARIRELEADRVKPWGYRLSTVAPPDPPGTTYPSINETYELALVDTSYSERLLLLKSKELDDRIQQLESTIAACKAAGFVTESGEVRRVLGQLMLTAEGHIVADGGRVYFVGSDGETVVEWDASGTGDHIPVEVCYSSRAAAEAAKGGREG